MERMMDDTLKDLLAYKGVYALCTVGKERQLKATHYAACLISGQNPVWVIHTVNGKFVRFAGSRAQIEEQYPKLVWRRRMATWTLTNAEHKPLPQRRQELAQRYKAKLPEGNT
jgi:hypothetical protein